MSKNQKSTIEVKGTDVILNCGKYAAIKMNRQSMPISQSLKPLEFEGFGMRAYGRRIVRSLTAQSGFFYATGVPSFSPGLRGTRYPGTSSHHTSQPQRGCAPCDAALANPDGTALRFDFPTARNPRVGLIAFGQPWAGGRKPVRLDGHVPRSIPASSNVPGIISSMRTAPPNANRFFPSAPSSSPNANGFSLSASSSSSNATGVPFFSPGMRGTRYPGTSFHHASQPQRGCAPCDAATANPDGTALRFDFPTARNPRVGLIAFGQPWAGGRKPVGLECNANHSIP